MIRKRHRKHVGKHRKAGLYYAWESLIPRMKNAWVGKVDQLPLLCCVKCMGTMSRRRMSMCQGSRLCLRRFTNTTKTGIDNSNKIVSKRRHSVSECTGWQCIHSRHAVWVTTMLLFNRIGTVPAQLLMLTLLACCS